MVRHLVLIKSADTVEVERVLQRIATLKGKVPGLDSVEIGLDFTGKHMGYTHLFILNFAGRDNLKVWAEHPEHLPIRNTLMRVAEMIVFDYEL